MVAAIRRDDQARVATMEESEVAAEVSRAMKEGSALVQASLAHLADGERLWDRWVNKSGAVIKGFPSEEQVLHLGLLLGLGFGLRLGFGLGLQLGLGYGQGWD